MKHLLLATLLVLGAARSVHAEPEFRGVPLSRFLDALKGEKDLRKRKIALVGIGVHGLDEGLWSDMTRRRRAGLIGARLIGAVKAPEIIPAISEAMQKDYSSLIRREAARTLGIIGKDAKANSIRFDPAFNAIVATLRTDPSPRVREAAAIAIGQIDPVLAGKGVQALIDVLDDPDPAVRNAAADSLRRLKKYAENALPALIAILKNPEGQVLTRMQAALAIGQIGGEKAVEGIGALRDAVADQRTPEDLRVAAAESLGILGKDAAKTAPALAKVLTNSEESVRVRRAVVAALDQFGANASGEIPQLLKAMKDADQFVRGLAMHAVGQMGPQLGDHREAVLTALMIGTDDSVLEVRVTAIQTLGNYGKDVIGDKLKDVAEKVGRLQRSSQPDVREAAIAAWKKLQ